MCGVSTGDCVSQFHRQTGWHRSRAHLSSLLVADSGHLTREYQGASGPCRRFKLRPNSKYCSGPVRFTLLGTPKVSTPSRRAQIRPAAIRASGLVVAASESVPEVSGGRGSGSHSGTLDGARRKEVRSSRCCVGIQWICPSWSRTRPDDGLPWRHPKLASSSGSD